MYLQLFDPLWHTWLVHGKQCSFGMKEEIFILAMVA